MNEQTGRAAAELADARCDVVATACLVALMAQGPGFHCTAEDQIREVLRAEGALVPRRLLRGRAARRAARAGRDAGSRWSRRTRSR